MRINHAIKGYHVRVTLENGQPLGIMPVREALQRAIERGLDLVEVAPTANPPVCRIMDYGRFKYGQAKAKKQQVKNNKQIELKEIQVSPVITDHDLQTKISAIQRFLKDGKNVQVTCLFTKRQIMYRDQGYTVIDKITEAINGHGVQEKAPAFSEKKLQVRFKPVSKE